MSHITALLRCSYDSCLLARHAAHLCIQRQASADLWFPSHWLFFFFFRQKYYLPCSATDHIYTWVILTCCHINNQSEQSRHGNLF